MARYKQGFYKPINPEKFSNPKQIVYRSSWELKFMLDLDRDPNVIFVKSEEIIIPYIDHKGTRRRYFVDFLVKRKIDNEIREQLIEVKPKSQTLPPVLTEGKATKTKIKAVLTWDMNQRKWAAARKYCEKKGWDFIIMTEEELGIPKRGKK